MNTRFRWIVSAVSVTLILSLAASCGRKTDPATPDSPRPEAVKDLKAEVRNDAAHLSWRAPARNTEGKDMDPGLIQGYDIYRAVIDKERKRPRYKQVVEIASASPAPAVIRNNVVFWTDAGLRYGQVYGYRIRAMSAGGGVGQWSDEIRVVPLLSLAQPKNVSAAGEDSQVQVSWEPVGTRMDGSVYDGFVGYNIYRGTEKARREDSPLNKEPLRTNAYKDTTAANDKTYFYIVRSVDSPARPWRESPDSSEVSATSRDKTAPLRPEGLTVVPGVNRAFLTWNENKERDLAGYHVYRSIKSGKNYERLTDRPVKRTTYSDETVKAVTAYYYIVTAVDQSGNESPPSKEQMAFAEKLR